MMSDLTPPPSSTDVHRFDEPLHQATTPLPDVRDRLPFKSAALNRLERSNTEDTTPVVLYRVNYLEPLTEKPSGVRTGSIVLRQHVIQTIYPATMSVEEIVKEQQGPCVVIQLPEQLVLTPGLIEQHCHGGFGCDFLHATIPQIQNCLRQLPTLGITGVLPTLISAPLEEMITAIDTLEETQHLSQSYRTRILGLHLEGPFLSKDFRGAHPEAALTPCDPDFLMALISPSVRMVTLAPELPGAQALIKQLVSQDVRVSIGHTNATADQCREAILNGATCFTHLFNAMRPLHHRQPGPLHVALTDEEVFTEYIGDGAHLHPETVKLLHHIRPLDRMLLVSDCMALAGMPDTETAEFGGQRVQQRHGAIRTVHDGGLVGSAQFVSHQVRTLAQSGVTSFEAAIYCATQNVADHLGYGNLLGQIAPGFLADLTLWRRDTLEPVATWINGQLLYHHESLSGQLARHAMQAQKVLPTHVETPPTVTDISTNAGPKGLFTKPLGLRPMLWKQVAQDDMPSYLGLPAKQTESSSVETSKTQPLKASEPVPVAPLLDFDFE